MTIEEIIALFEDIEKGNEGQMVGYHLHSRIQLVTQTDWSTMRKPDGKFSDFLKDLAEHENPLS